MGHLQAFDVQKLIDHFNIYGYIETGTGVGDSLYHALSFPFKKLYTIEYDYKLFSDIVSEMTNNQHGIDSRLKLINDMSKKALPKIIKEIDEKDTYLFFLDAHFPGADFTEAPDRYVVSRKKYGDDAIPLRDELEIIYKMRPLHKDVIIIDDVWIYEKGPFERGNWEEKDKLNIGDMGFVYEIFKDHYSFQKNYKQQGYLILTPLRHS